MVRDTKIVIGLCLSLVVAVCSALEARAMKQELAEAQQNMDLTARAPITLNQNYFNGVSIAFQEPPLTSMNSATLVSIDRQDLRSKTLVEIDRLLYGPPGSTVELEVVLPDGQCKTIATTRQTLLKQRRFIQVDERTLDLVTSQLDQADCRNWNSALVQSNLDIPARAIQALVVRSSQRAPVPKGNMISIAALCAALTNYEVGNIKGGDYYISQFSKELDPSQRMLLNQNRNIGDAVNVLLSVGREKEANQILNVIHKQNGNDKFRRINDEAAILKAFVAHGVTPEIQSSSNIFNETKILWHSVDLNYLADFQRKSGHDLEALELYQKGLQQLAPNQLDAEHFLFNHLRSYALFRSSEIQGKLGKQDMAIKSLDQCAAIFGSANKQLLEACERMPFFFPRLSDIQTLRTQLNSRATATAIPPVEFNLDQADHSYGNIYKLIRDCDESITQGNLDMALRQINALLDRCELDNLPEQSNHPQSLFCSILSLARNFTDKGWIDESTSVLLRLSKIAKIKSLTSISNSLVTAELVYNAESVPSKKKTKAQDRSADLWNKLQIEFSLTKIENSGKTDYSLNEKLRRLAVCYYYADDIKRAGFFSSRATACLSEEGIPPGYKIRRKSSGSLGEEILLLLDRACISAKQEMFDEADSLVQQIFSKPAIELEGYDETVVELASIYTSKGKASQAESILRSAVRNMPMQNGGAFRPKPIRSPVQAALAKMLFDRNEYREAKSLMGSAIFASANMATSDMYVIAGECAERLYQYSDAASYYEQAAKSNTFFSFALVTSADFELTYLDKAQKMAEKDPNFDKKHLAQLCMEIARQKQASPDQLETSYRMYERAGELFTDTDPLKASALVNRANIMAMNSGYGPKAVRSPEELTLRLQAARLAEKHNDNSTQKYWFDLASAEADSKPDLAIEHARHAIALYTGKEMFAYPFYTGLTHSLNKQGRTSEVVMLMNEAIKRVKSARGSTSLSAQAQMLVLFHFYVLIKNETEALKVLDNILLFDSGMGNRTSVGFRSRCFFGPGPHFLNNDDIIVDIRRTAESIRSKERQFALTILNRILVAQKRLLPKDDELIGRTLVSLGDYYFFEDNMLEAIRSYSEAFRISKLYMSPDRAIAPMLNRYQEALKKTGKENEAKKLGTLQYDVPKLPFRMQ